jgi:hypothetical protein
MFAFTSLGAKIDTGVNKGSGPYVFKINGQVHHRIGSLLPDEGAAQFMHNSIFFTLKTKFKIKYPFLIGIGSLTMVTRLTNR